MAIINALKGELIKMKKYCLTLENHIRSVQSGEVDASAPIPVRFSLSWLIHCVLTIICIKESSQERRKLWQSQISIRK